jgi:ketosteroid isomerase-like protein
VPRVTALEIVSAFGGAWADHDLEQCLAQITPDCVFESTGPAPDGVRAVGPDEIRALWQPIFDNQTSRFDVEDTIIAGDQVVQQWRYDWGDGHVRGVDLFRVRDGKVCEKFSYVKG